MIAAEDETITQQAGFASSFGGGVRRTGCGAAARGASRQARPAERAVPDGGGVRRKYNRRRFGHYSQALLGEPACRAQLEPVKMINSGLGANLISTRSAYYEQSGKPAAMLRYPKHVIEHHPDLVLVSFGLNDARAGTPVGQFIEDLRHIVTDIKSKTEAVMVMVNAYFMTDFDRYDPFKLGSISSFRAYNAAEKDLAQECDVLYADVFDAEGMAPWTIDPDGVHANNLGHRLIANKVFETLAKNCSALAASAVEARKTFTPWRDESVLKRLY